MDLQKKAELIVNEYEFEEILNSFGEAHIVGNVALKTTVKPDIDFQIYAKKENFQLLANKIMEKLLELKPNTIESHKLAQSDKYLVTATFIENKIIWTLDISLTEPNKDYLKDAYRFYVDFNSKLNDTNRSIIKKLKLDFLKENRLKNSMAYYIYRAVIDEGATTSNDVLKYINKIRK